MLSKRTNDVIFIGIIVLVIIGIVAMRFIVLGTMADVIERAEVDNQELESEIAAMQQKIADYQIDNPVPISVLYQRAPAFYSRDRLTYTVYAHLELAGISDTSGRNLAIAVTDNPNFPEDTEFRRLAEDLTAVRIRITFNTHDAQDIYRVIDTMHNIQQHFVLQAIGYDATNPDQPSRITIDFVTFYNLSE